jgi:hypothetical protein
MYVYMYLLFCCRFRFVLERCIFLSLPVYVSTYLFISKIVRGDRCLLIVKHNMYIQWSIIYHIFVSANDLNALILIFKRIVVEHLRGAFEI